MDLAKKLRENKNTIILVVIIGGIFLGFWSLSRGKEPLLSVIVRTPNQEIIGRELVVELERLRTLSRINTSLFNDPVFGRLQDTEVRPAVQSIGRRNPFVPQALE